MKHIRPLFVFVCAFVMLPLGAQDGTSADDWGAWCDQMYEKGCQLEDAGEMAKAHQAWQSVLKNDSRHVPTLIKIGFRIDKNGAIAPIPQRLLTSGWEMDHGSWQPAEGFDHNRLPEVTAWLRKDVKRLARKLGQPGKDDSLKNDLEAFKARVVEEGPTAVPELTRLAKKASTRRERTFALASLAPLKPAHMIADLAVNYPVLKDDAQAAATAAVLANLLPAIPDRMADRIEKGNEHEAMRVAQLAALMEAKDLTPRIRARWRVIQEQTITQPGGVRNVVTQVSQRAYIRDLTAVVGVQIGLFDPDIGYIQSGGVMDVRVVKVEIFRTILEKLSGEPGLVPGDEAEINKEVFGRP